MLLFFFFAGLLGSFDASICQKNVWPAVLGSFEGSIAKKNVWLAVLFEEFAARTAIFEPMSVRFRTPRGRTAEDLDLKKFCFFFSDVTQRARHGIFFVAIRTEHY